MKLLYKFTLIFSPRFLNLARWERDTDLCFGLFGSFTHFVSTMLHTLIILTMNFIASIPYYLIAPFFNVQIFERSLFFETNWDQEPEVGDILMWGSWKVKMEHLASGYWLTLYWNNAFVWNTSLNNFWIGGLALSRYEDTMDMILVTLDWHLNRSNLIKISCLFPRIYSLDSSGPRFSW